MIQPLFTLALKTLMKKYTCSEIRESRKFEVQKIRQCMLNNYKFEINYRTPNCCNQLHYYTGSPQEILNEIDSGGELWEIGMKDLNF